jgi:hypothetical protein
MTQFNPTDAPHDGDTHHKTPLRFQAAIFLKKLLFVQQAAGDSGAQGAGPSGSIPTELAVLLERILQA